MVVPLFIFASTACRFIGDTISNDPEEQVVKIIKYKGLSATYLPVLNEMLLERTVLGYEAVTEMRNPR